MMLNKLLSLTRVWLGPTKNLRPLTLQPVIVNGLFFDIITCGDQNRSIRDQMNVAYR